MLAEYLLNNIKEHRQNLHRIPELGFEEHKTKAYLRRVLEELGYEPLEVCRTGLLVFIEGEGRDTYAFRTDIDALSIDEENDLNFKSEHEGKMHACGHDGHMASLLGLAEYLKDKKLKKNILLIFQPAEEGPGGAKFIVEEGVLELYNVKGIFGMHLFPTLKEGLVAAKKGPMMAQTGEIDISVKGRSGHGAMPHTTIDTLLITSKLIDAYQSIVARNISPMSNAVLTFGKIRGGSARNIIAEKVEIEGTARAFSREEFDYIMERMCDINRGFERAFGVEIKEDIRPLYPAVYNSPELYEKFVEGLKKKNMDYKEIEAVMLAEDFAYYQEAVDGIFFFLGTGNEEKGYTSPLHSCRFNFDEKVLGIGVEVYISVLEQFEII